MEENILNLKKDILKSIILAKRVTRHSLNNESGMVGILEIFSGIWRMEDLVSKHHKSIRRVWKFLCILLDPVGKKSGPIAFKRGRKTGNTK